jgi:predicted component of type VI protein secretion system
LCTPRPRGAIDGIVVGRDAGEIRIDDSRISRQHVRIERVTSGWRLVDLGSRNGGVIDGRSSKTHEHAAMSDGAVLLLGDSLLVVFCMSPALGDSQSEVEAFPGVSPAAAAVRRRIDVLPAAPGHALILGETGTGKERVARAIAEPRKAQLLVTQNCGKLGRELARAELFGHTQGAFSGATHSMRGLGDAAGDGVLFLDEIGELSLDVQKELLRFLEDETDRPVGPGGLHSSAVPPAWSPRQTSISTVRQRAVFSPRPSGAPAREQRSARVAATARAPRGHPAVVPAVLA